MKKLLALVCAAGMAGLWSGCGLTDPTDAEITVTINTIPAVTANSGSVSFTVKIESDSAISAMTYQVKQGGTDKTSLFTITPPAVNDYNGKKNVTLNFSLAAGSGANGSYDFYVNVTAGDINDDDTRAFTVTGGGTPVTEKTDISLGAQNAAPPSLLDADNMTTHSVTITDETTRGSIDVIFVYATVSGNQFLAFTSPSVAAGSPYDTWTNKAASEFKKVTADYATITTQEQIDALWGTEAGDTRVQIAQGDVIVIKTSAGAYKLVQITAISGTDGSATMSIKGKY
ncbi:MAG: hypothetical protein JXA71_04185 [Chitinispirillaceae bacterium]|nr:hypothetical protein [Chitinispirillaceae bacterium]